MPPFVMKVNGIAGRLFEHGAKIRLIQSLEFPISYGHALAPLSTTPSISQNIAGRIGVVCFYFDFYEDF